MPNVPGRVNLRKRATSPSYFNKQAGPINEKFLLQKERRKGETHGQTPLRPAGLKGECGGEGVKSQEKRDAD